MGADDGQAGDESLWWEAKIDGRAGKWLTQDGRS